MNLKLRQRGGLEVNKLVHFLNVTVSDSSSFFDSLQKIGTDKDFDSVYLNDDFIVGIDFFFQRAYFPDLARGHIHQELHSENMVESYRNHAGNIFSFFPSAKYGLFLFLLSCHI